MKWILNDKWKKIRNILNRIERIEREYNWMKWNKGLKLNEMMIKMIMIDIIKWRKRIIILKNMKIVYENKRE